MTKFNAQKELQTRGMYASCGKWYGGPYPPVERLTQPITPRENLLRYYRGEEYEWIPDLLSDEVDFTPACNPDADASDFEGGYDAFGVKWIPDTSNPNLPSFVEPGFMLIDDIADWKKLKWPDVDSWNWKECADQYNEALAGDDRLRRGVLLSGYFERLISIMTFQNAAMSLLEDPDSVEEFFDKLTETNIEIADHYIDDFHCESLMIHDDWSAQRSPFFSLNTAMDLLTPQLKKLTEHVHARGCIMTLHSCGNGLALIPAMKAAGVDAWQAQTTAVNWDDAYEACGDDLIIEAYPTVPAEISLGDEMKNYMQDMVNRYAVKHKGLIEFYDSEPGSPSEVDMNRPFEMRKTFYEVGRQTALNIQ